LVTNPNQSTNIKRRICCRRIAAVFFAKGKSMSQGQWFYVDKNQRRIGPVSATLLVDALRNGQLGLESLVWREGMGAWQALSQNLDAVGVPEAMRVRKVQKSSNAAIWVIAIVVGGFFLIALVGILAAIALPAYQDYTIRAKVSSAVIEASSAQGLVLEHLDQHNECPDNNAPDTQLPTPDSYASLNVQRVDIGSLDNGNCAVQITVSDTIAPGQVSGSIYKELINEEAGQWVCYSDKIKDKYLSSDCRSGDNKY
jgi:type IV pilus assembly protein PilA